ncbi:hypothetical protein I41_38850 [Lacipirellula limnantheis]|uniref:Sulfatase n=1 Tax=Lacipirellula limnantheis TaxID=2528024 RepID=A0A517U235_9BACT|nr:hypothetical protein I41_38850 [Lacipirellula limnantheis]
MRGSQQLSYVPAVNRRDFLQRAACGFGSIALQAMLADIATAAKAPLAPRATHFAARAKRVIFLFMAGGPSQHDLFVPKPRLVRDHGRRVGLTDLPSGAPVGTDKFLTLGPMAPILPRGESGATISTLLPHLAKVADDLCFLHGMQVDNPAHDLATLQFNTGVFNEVRPAMGAWASYGLGSENENLPGFVSIHADADVRAYGSAFLPAAHQGTVIGQIPTDPRESAIRFLSDPETTKDAQRRRIDFVQAANRELLDRIGEDRVMEGVIDSFELAFRMQTATPQLVDLSTEAAETLALYGVGTDATDKNGRACLLARRLCEAGVRFVQVTIGGWDHHGDIRGALPNSCLGADQPVAALIIDLKRRGLLDDTLVVWSGEFGRTPWSQDITGTAPLEKHGREHQPESFTTFLAGGGVRRGFSHGETDEFGYKTTSGRVHIHDLHATILHLLGLDHERLTYRHAGRDYRLTDVYGTVIRQIIA